MSDAEQNEDLVAQHPLHQPAPGRESVQDLCQQHRDVVPAAVVVGQLNQVLGDRTKIITKGVYG